MHIAASAVGGCPTDCRQRPTYCSCVEDDNFLPFLPHAFNPFVDDKQLTLGSATHTTPASSAPATASGGWLTRSSSLSTCQDCSGLRKRGGGSSRSKHRAESPAPNLQINAFRGTGVKCPSGLLAPRQAKPRCQSPQTTQSQSLLAS